MSDILKELEAAAGPSVGQLSTISKLCALQIMHEGEVDRLAGELKEAKKALLKISDVELPDAMKAAKTKKFVTEEGRTVELKDEMTISIPKKRQDEILEKLRTWGFGDLVANTLTCDIEKGQDNLAGEIISKAEEIGLTMERTETVNSGSVKRVLKDKIKEGEEVDLTFFGAFQVMRAKITQ